MRQYNSASAGVTCRQRVTWWKCWWMVQAVVLYFDSASPSCSVQLTVYIEQGLDVIQEVALSWTTLLGQSSTILQFTRPFPQQVSRWSCQHA